MPEKKIHNKPAIIILICVLCAFVYSFLFRLHHGPRVKKKAAFFSLLPNWNGILQVIGGDGGGFFSTLKNAKNNK